MATITSRAIVDRIIAANGQPDNAHEPAAVKIVEYINKYNEETCWGVIFAGEDLDRYRPSDFILDPKTIWTKPDAVYEAASPEEFQDIFTKALAGQLPDAQVVVLHANPKDVHRQLFPIGPEGCTGCHNPDMNFRDAVSRREYDISHLCQRCQDEAFGTVDEDDW